MSYSRHQPAGAFLVEHFMNSNDQRTHLERINPIGPGETFGYCPGASGSSPVEVRQRVWHDVEGEEEPIEYL